MVQEQDTPFLVKLIGNSATKWKEILGQCGLLPGDVDFISKDPFCFLSGNYLTACLTAGLRKWYTIRKNDEEGHAFDPMFSVLISALRSQVVNKRVLANTLIEKRSELPSAPTSGGREKGT